MEDNYAEFQVDVLGNETNETNQTTNQTDSCSDSDWGVNPDVFGSVTVFDSGDTFIYNDFCFVDLDPEGDPNFLLEAYCDGDSHKYTNITCSNGCLNGTCVGGCEPDCYMNECGDDGCGGSCGTCGSGEACYGGQCYLEQECVLVDAFWTATSVMEGTEVQMVVIGNGSCNGDEVGFALFEDDFTGDDQVVFNPENPFHFSGNQVVASWVAEYQEDASGDPEYYFQALDVDTVDVIRSNNLLTVYQNDNTSVCGDGILEMGEECDGDYLNGLTCLDFGYDEGILVCDSECTFDLNYCSFNNSYCGDEICNGNETGVNCPSDSGGNQTVSGIIVNGVEVLLLRVPRPCETSLSFWKLFKNSK